MWKTNSLIEFNDYSSHTIKKFLYVNRNRWLIRYCWRIIGKKNVCFECARVFLLAKIEFWLIRDTCLYSVGDMHWFVTLSLSVTWEQFPLLRPLAEINREDNFLLNLQYEFSLSVQKSVMLVQKESYEPMQIKFGT